MNITNFSGEYEFLSNFYEVPVKYRYTYGSAEAAYQAQKVANPYDADDFTRYNPGKAKRMARKLELRDDWQDVRLAVMSDVVWAKFFQNTELAERLLATGDAALIEVNDWHDNFWGVDSATGNGQNNLGKILMETRAALKNPEISLLESGNATITRFTAPEVRLHPLITPNMSFNWSTPHAGDIRLNFNRAYKIDSADEESFDGIENFTWQFRGKTFKDLSCMHGNPIGLIDENDDITQLIGVRNDGMKVFYQHEEIPTFDNSDEKWDGANEFIVFRDAGGVHMIQSRHGWEIPDVNIYVALKNVEPALKKILTLLD